jgi:hypothetical protein
MGTKDEKRKIILQKELEAYNKNGVKLTLDGQDSNGQEIVEACFIGEESNYMRDYIRDKKGEIEEIAFDKIKEN